MGTLGYSYSTVSGHCLVPTYLSTRPPTNLPMFTLGGEEGKPELSEINKLPGKRRPLSCPVHVSLPVSFCPAAAITVCLQLLYDTSILH